MEKILGFLAFESRKASEDCLVLFCFYRKPIEWDRMVRILEFIRGTQMNEGEMKSLAMGPPPLSHGLSLARVRAGPAMHCP